jgi:hypothetical protein
MVQASESRQMNLTESSCPTADHSPRLTNVAALA